MIAKNWFIKPKKGGSCFPHPLTCDHMILEVKDVITLLNKIKDTKNTFFWEKNIYFIAQIILRKNKYIDWAKIIPDKLNEELSQVSRISVLYMSSYVFYILAWCQEWEGLPYIV